MLLWAFEILALLECVKRWIMLDDGYSCRLSLSFSRSLSLSLALSRSLSLSLPSIRVEQVQDVESALAHHRHAAAKTHEARDHAEFNLMALQSLEAVG